MVISSQILRGTQQVAHII